MLQVVQHAETADAWTAAGESGTAATSHPQCPSAGGQVETWSYNWEKQIKDLILKLDSFKIYLCLVQDKAKYKF